MPIYDYRCTKCGDFEYSQSIKAEPLTACPKCGNQVKRLISNNVGIIFKGSGFYITDSRQADSNNSSSD
ncbi:MAG: zinc ribbon domain-containing protein [Firmicutes bacterium]|nr:zinc ribbon domain-containing protein [Bacillota bacterium]